MNYPIISRTLAVVVLSVPMGWSMADMNQAEMVRYRSLGHHELLAVLEANHSMGLVGSLVLSIAMLGLAFLALLGLSLGIDRALGALPRASHTP